MPHNESVPKKVYPPTPAEKYKRMQDQIARFEAEERRRRLDEYMNGSHITMTDHPVWDIDSSIRENQ